MLIIFVQYRIVIQLPGREKAKSIFMFLKISNLCACVCKLILCLFLLLTKYFVHKTKCA